MDEMRGATIIPFVDKRAHATATRVLPVENSAAQLTEALERLSAALLEQQAATQQWDKAIATLSANLRHIARDPTCQGGCPGRG